MALKPGRVDLGVLEFSLQTGVLHPSHQQLHWGWKPYPLDWCPLGWFLYVFIIGTTSKTNDTRPGKHTKSELEHGPVEIVSFPM